MRKALALAAGVLVLAIVNWTIYSRERQLAEGRVVLLALAPVDPRSLMQGDYMALRFKIANEARPAMQHSESSGVRRFPGQGGLATADGRIVAALDPGSVATYRRLDDGAALLLARLALNRWWREAESARA